jgi:hypothetical protein
MNMSSRFNLSLQVSQLFWHLIQTPYQNQNVDLAESPRGHSSRLDNEPGMEVSQIHPRLVQRQTDELFPEIEKFRFGG